MFVITAETANSSKKRFYIRSLSVSVLCNFTLVICSNNLLINAFLKYCISAPCAEAGGVLKNFTIFTRKYLSQSLFIEKEALAQVFSCEFCKNILFTEHLLTTALLRVVNSFH